MEQEEKSRKKKEIEEKEVQELREEEERLERKKSAMRKTEQSILEKEKTALSELGVAEKMLQEGNEKMAIAIKNKDFAALSIAQALVETAQKKMTEAKKVLSTTGRQTRELNERKDRMIESMKRKMTEDNEPVAGCSKSKEPNRSKLPKK